MAGKISLEPLQQETLASLSLVRDEIERLLGQYLGDASLASGTLRALFWYHSERSQTVSFLVSWRRIWDAEIILRSFYEVSIKILFLCFSPADKRASLFEEFWLDNENISARRRARKAKYAEKVFSEDDLSFSVFSLLQNDKLYDLSTKFTKAQRKEIERRWSFSELIENLSKMSPSGRSLEDIKCFLHIYGTASHLIHGDGAALDLMADRRLRGSEELAILEASHVSRIWRDQFEISRFCAHALTHYIGCKSINGDKMDQASKKLQEMRAPLKAAFDESQRDFYAAYKTD